MIDSLQRGHFGLLLEDITVRIHSLRGERARRERERERERERGGGGRWGQEKIMTVLRLGTVMNSPTCSRGGYSGSCEVLS